MAPEEVEAQIAFPIESALNGAPGVRRVRSSGGVGISVVWAEFEWGEDVYRARQIVAEKLQLAEAQLPRDVQRPQLAPVSSIMGEILFVALVSDKHSPMELKTAADWTLRRRLLSIPGVSQVIPTGGETRQYQILLKPERLSAHELTADQVIAALRETNESTSGGFAVEGGASYLIHGTGRVRTLDDVALTAVAVKNRVPVLVRDLGEVRIGPALKLGEGSHDGKPAVVIGIQKQPGANTLELTKRLDAAMDEIGKALPEGMRIERRIFRQADFVQASVHNVTAALRDGAILVLIIVLLFLSSARATAITLLALPLSLLAAILAMKATGATINTMTLGGMAIAVGELVDDAIIDVENVLRRLRQNRTLPPEQQKAALQVVLEPASRSAARSSTRPPSSCSSSPRSSSSPASRAGCCGRWASPTSYRWQRRSWSRSLSRRRSRPSSCRAHAPCSTTARADSRPGSSSGMRASSTRPCATGNWWRAFRRQRSWPPRSRSSSSAARSCPSSTRARSPSAW